MIAPSLDAENASLPPADMRRLNTQIGTPPRRRWRGEWHLSARRYADAGSFAQTFGSGTQRSDGEEHRSAGVDRGFRPEWRRRWSAATEQMHFGRNGKIIIKSKLDVFPQWNESVRVGVLHTQGESFCRCTRSRLRSGPAAPRYGIVSNVNPGRTRRGYLNYRAIRRSAFHFAPVFERLAQNVCGFLSQKIRPRFLCALRARRTFIRHP
jgi:hypothetical protein